MKKSNAIVRPLLLSILVAGACDAMAADRVDLEKNNAARASIMSIGGRVTAAQHIGLSTDELKEVRSQKYANGKTITRHQQFHQGIPVWGEAIVEHRGATDNTPTMSGAMLSGLAQDLPSVKPTYSASQILSLAKGKAQVSNTSNDQSKL